MSAAPVTALPTDRGAVVPRFFDVVSADGTRLRAWTNDVDGPVVLLCNGLGTNAYAWSSLLDPDCGVRVISWNHRGTGGSDRPEDESRVGVEVHVEDAIAVMDATGTESSVAMGWSMGVNLIFELARRHPHRVDALYAVAGVPGGTFSSMLAPVLVPRPVRKPITVGLTRVLKLLGAPLTAVTSRLPVGPVTMGLLTRSGFMMPVADEALSQRAIKEFLETPMGWYMHLALHASLHGRVPLRNIDVPTSFLAGTYDLMASAYDMRSAAKRIPGAVYKELPGTHFLPLERPTQVHQGLLQLLARVPR